MVHAHPLIVQADFFLVPFDNSLEQTNPKSRYSVQNEYLKACVRFFDTRGSVGKLVMYAHLAEARSEAIRDMLALSTETSYLKEYSLQHQSALKEFRVRKSDLHRCVIQELRFATIKNLGVALEQTDYSYRPVPEGEFALLLKNVVKAPDVWVFLFPPGNLLADSHEHMIGVM